jgi:pilus assembly protein CpaE
MAEKILIVDDDLDTLRLVGLLLERQGYQIIVADNGSQALDKAISEAPEIILLDVMMPDMDGFEVARRLRDNEITGEIPIIFFTAKTQVDDKVAGFEVGADDYLTKPVHPAELTARVKAILARSGKGRVTMIQPETERGKVIGIMAARGGVGITTLALNLGLAIKEESEEEVIIAELRPGQGTISLELGFSNPMGLINLLQKKSDEISSAGVQRELVEHATGVRLLMASHQPSDAQFTLAIPQFNKVVQHLSRMAKYTVLDLGPSLPPASEKVLETCDIILVGVPPESNAVAHTKALLDDLSLRVLGLDRINVTVINRTHSDLKLSRSQIQDQLGHSVPYLFTPVPKVAHEAARKKIPMLLVEGDEMNAQQTNNTQQYKAMAQAIVSHGQKVNA